MFGSRKGVGRRAAAGFSKGKARARDPHDASFNSQVGETLIGDASATVNADWSVGSAQGRIAGSRDMPARRLSCCRYRNRSRRFKKLQRSLSVLRKRRGDHRWMQAGASSAVNSSHAWSFNFPSSEHGTRKWLCEVNVRRARPSQKRQTGGRWRLSQRTVPTVETGASSERRLPLTTPSRETGAGARSHSEGRHFSAGSRVAHFSRRRDSPCLGLVVAHSRLLVIAGEGVSLTTKVSEASRTSGRRGQYPPRIRVGRRSGQRRRETPCPLVAPCWL